MRSHSSFAGVSWIMAAMLVALLGMCTLPQPGHAQDMAVPRILQTVLPGAIPGIIPQEQYNFLPAPDKAMECFSGVDISGDLAAPITSASSSLACATLCESNPACTFYTFKAPSPLLAGECALKYNPFNRNGVPMGASRNPLIAAACFNKAKSGSIPSPSNYLCYAGQQISGTILRTYAATNPQACVDSCTSTQGCTFSMFDSNSQCMLGSSAFQGSQDNSFNRPNSDILNLCLRATGAQDTVATKGFVCYDKVNIAGGQLISTESQVPSKEVCNRLCEARSEVCTLAVYTPGNQQCSLMSDAFTAAGSGRDAAKVSCLRVASGGNMNSPGDYLCYASQSLAGSEIIRGAGVADSVACANLCTANPSCTFTMYLPIGSGTCILKKDAFYGNESPAMNQVDYTVTSLCLEAPGAPIVLSGFGNNPKNTQPKA